MARTNLTIPIYLCAALVVFVAMGGVIAAYGFGTDVFDRLAEGEQSATARLSVCRLKIISNVDRPKGIIAVAESLVCAGGSGGGPVAMALAGESSGRLRSAHVWLALDSEARGLPQLARRHEQVVIDSAERAIARNNTAGRIAILDSLLAPYEEWLIWSRVHWKQADQIQAFEARLDPIP